MDQTLVVDRTASIEVIVSREAVGGPIHEAAAEGAAEVDPGRRLIIQVLPKASVEVVGESQIEIDIPATGQPTTVYFDLRPTNSGERASGSWRAGSNPARDAQAHGSRRPGRLGREPRLAGRRRASRRQSHRRPSRCTSFASARPSEGGTLFYEFELEAPELDLLDMFESRPITGNPQDYVGSLHERIEDRWLRTKGDVEEFTQELREFGGELLDELIPDKLQEILWVNRRRFTSIQVLATEPFIPWSVHLRQPGKPLPRRRASSVRWDSCDGCTAVVGRRTPPGAAEPRPLRDPGLPGPTVRAARGPAGTQVPGGHVRGPSRGAAADSVPQAHLDQGAFDLLHFAGHGAAETEAVTEARLLLQGRIEDGEYIEAPFTTTTVYTRANLTAADGARPLVVLNACQTGRLGYALTGISGFAQAFLNAGAGAFVGTQWSVSDVPGRVFTETFYTKLLDGATVAEATVASREQARADGDATWLAYAVYAHPHARLVHQRSP